MIVSPRMDDEIIYSWCFNYVECFGSTPYAAIIVLVENLESLSSLKSQKLPEVSREYGYKLSIMRRRKWLLQNFKRLVNIFHLFRNLVKPCHLLKMLVNLSTFLGG